MCQPFFQDSVVRLPLFCLYLRPGIASQFKGREDIRCLLPVMSVYCPVLPWPPSVHEADLEPGDRLSHLVYLFLLIFFLNVFFFHLFSYSFGGRATHAPWYTCEGRGTTFLQLSPSTIWKKRNWTPRNWTQAISLGGAEPSQHILEDKVFENFANVYRILRVRCNCLKKKKKPRRWNCSQNEFLDHTSLATGGEAAKPIPVGGNGHQPLRKYWLPMGVCCPCCFLPSMCKETVGFPGHFSHSLNTEELKHFGFGSLDRDSQLGGLSRRLAASVSELSVCTPTPSCTVEVFLLSELKWTVLENLPRSSGGQSLHELPSWRGLTGRKTLNSWDVPLQTRWNLYKHPLFHPPPSIPFTTYPVTKLLKSEES